jgi:hypothetical protein
MEHTARTAETSERVPAVRLLRVGALAAALSAGGNALVLAISSSLFGPEGVRRDEVTRDVERRLVTASLS